MWKIGNVAKLENCKCANVDKWDRRTDRQTNITLSLSLSVPLVHFYTFLKFYFSIITLFDFSTFPLFDFSLVDFFIPIYTISYPFIPIHNNIYNSYSGLDSFGVLHTFEGEGFL